MGHDDNWQVCKLYWQEMLVRLERAVWQDPSFCFGDPIPDRPGGTEAAS
jgi:hypothetical protein